jgi:hypothetical protein
LNDGEKPPFSYVTSLSLVYQLAIILNLSFDFCAVVHRIVLIVRLADIRRSIRAFLVGDN